MINHLYILMVWFNGVDTNSSEPSSSPSSSCIYVETVESSKGISNYNEFIHVKCDFNIKKRFLSFLPSSFLEIIQTQQDEKKTHKLSKRICCFKASKSKKNYLNLKETFWVGVELFMIFHHKEEKQGILVNEKLFSLLKAWNNRHFILCSLFFTIQ